MYGSTGIGIWTGAATVGTTVIGRARRIPARSGLLHAMSGSATMRVIGADSERFARLAPEVHTLQRKGLVV